uniref:M-phase inducer phosphatase n=1 Tax=Dermatophagoides pteronyssinus TaxID=6956 RepID=A0A6P6Y6N5_DERPT|nr:M-phase inducer phosphatase 3-like [Dermatophagoides pteronyssinus]
MDESMMSIELNQSIDDHFDDDDFIQETLNVSMNNNSTNVEFKLPSPVSELITNVTLPKCRLDFNVSDIDTPRNSSTVARNRKRRNFTRRCLSTDLNGDHNNMSDQMSFQEFRFTKETTPAKTSINEFKSPVLSSIQNIISPRTTPKYNLITLELTPEFNNIKPSSSTIKSFDENDLIPKAKCIKSSSIKTLNSSNNSNNNNGGPNVPIQKYFSENHASIMRAVQLSSSDSTLIGDFSRTYALPLIQNSKHQDLRSIDCHVLANLLQNQQYMEKIRSFTIIDCRYPYEYDGGHIRTAINLYTQEHIINRFIKTKPKEADCFNNSDDDDDKQSSNDKRDILIFHCEFSSERGPSLCRFLRNKDRVKNSRVYPNLHYPEIYLLEGGYKEFYQHYSNLCEPCSYQPMHSKNHEEDLKKFRTICKSLDYKYSTRKRNLRL